MSLTQQMIDALTFMAEQPNRSVASKNVNGRTAKSLLRRGLVDRVKADPDRLFVTPAGAQYLKGWRP